MSRAADRVLVGLGWLVVVAGSVLGVLVGVVAAAGALTYMVPAEGCDSGCWRNGTLTRILGVLGIPLALTAVIVVPAATWFARSRPRTAAQAVLGVVVSLIAWWAVTQHLLNTAVAT